MFTIVEFFLKEVFINKFILFYSFKEEIFNNNDLIQKFIYISILWICTHSVAEKLNWER